MHRTIVTPAMIALMCMFACKSEGTIQGDLSDPTPAGTNGAASVETEKPADTEEPAEANKPAPKHERVTFTWESDDSGLSGTIQVTLPNNELFTGHYHEITATTTVDTLGTFYDTWYADGWAEPRWLWGGDWPYYDSGEEYITYYTGRVVALLDSDKGTSMRCTFQLDDAPRGMQGGGEGECQLSNGDRITAVFPAT